MLELRDAFLKLEAECGSFKDYKMHIEGAAERCNNQKKSFYPLSHVIRGDYSRLNDKMEQFRVVRKQVSQQVLPFDDKSLRENSSFFDSKRKSEALLQAVEKDFAHFKEHIEHKRVTMKEDVRGWKARFKDIEMKQMEFANSSCFSDIEQRLASNREHLAKAT